MEDPTQNVDSDLDDYFETVRYVGDVARWEDTPETDSSPDEPDGPDDDGVADLRWQIDGQLLQLDWDEALHPRADDGKFASGEYRINTRISKVSPLGSATRVYSGTMRDAKQVINASAAVIRGHHYVDPDAQEAATILVKSVRNAPEHETTLYRGLGSDNPIPSLEKAKVGDIITLGQLSSFSESEQFAGYYAHRQSLTGEYYKLKTVGPVKSISTDVHTGFQHKEHVTQGKFEVVSIDEAKSINDGGAVFVDKTTTGNKENEFYVGWTRSLTLRQVGVF
jgi:hypothetical protein